MAELLEAKGGSLSTYAADYFNEAGPGIVNRGRDVNDPCNYNGDDPVDCNEHIGKTALRIQAERIANAFRVFKEDENILKWHHKMTKGW